jgi:hypothetical protein
MLREKLTVAYRFVLSYSVLLLYLIVPTMALKKRYILAVAKLPVWKNFDFFLAMFRLIREDQVGASQGRA